MDSYSCGLIGRTKLLPLLLESISLDGKVALPYEHVVQGLQEVLNRILKPHGIRGMVLLLIF